MNINKIIEAIIDALSDQKMTILVIIMIGVAVLFASNIILGTIQGQKLEGFSWKKFLFGIEKALAMMLVTLALCFAFNMICIGAEMAEFITLGTPVIASTEIVGILLVYGIDLSKEVLEKFKTLRKLKYISFDDVVVSNINDHDVDKLNPDQIIDTVTDGMRG